MTESKHSELPFEVDGSAAIRDATGRYVAHLDLGSDAYEANAAKEGGK